MDRIAPDHDLLTATAAGDRNAFELLVVRHQGLVRAACQRQGVQAELEDCMQAVFLVLSRKALQAKRAPALEAWLLMVTRHVCANARRSASARHRAEQEAALHAATSAAVAADNAALEYLDVCIAHLPERQRVVIALHFLAGKPREDVAARLGIDVDTVHQHCRRGLERLRGLLSRHGVGLSTFAVASLVTVQGHTAIAAPPFVLAATSSNLAVAYATGATTAMTLSTLAPLGLATAALLVISASATIGLSSAEPAKTPPPTPIAATVESTAALPTAQVSGVVTSAVDGAPLPGVRVIATIFHRGDEAKDMLSERPARHPFFEAISDADGRYTMTIPVTTPHDCVGFDAFKRGFNSLGSLIGKPWYRQVFGFRPSDPQRAFLPLSVGAWRGPDISLEGPAPYLAGTVLDEEDRPVPGATVDVGFHVCRKDGIPIECHQSVVADTKGHFELFDLPPRPGVLDFILPKQPYSKDFHRRTVQAAFWDYESSGTIDISSASDEVLADVRIRIKKSKQGEALRLRQSADPGTILVDGRVVDQLNRPISGARLVQINEARPDMPAHEVACTDANGRFVIGERAVSGDKGAPLRIEVRYWKLEPATIIIDRSSGGAATREQVIHLAPADRYRLSGHLADVHGKPMPGVRIRIEVVPGIKEPLDKEPVVKELRTEEHGDFCFDFLPSGTVSMDIVDFKRGPWQSKRYVLTSDLLDQQIRFQAGPRPKPARTILLDGEIWADLTPELARYYGFRESDQRMVLVQSTDGYEGSVVSSISLDGQRYPGEGAVISGIDDFRKNVASLFDQSKKGPRDSVSFEYNTVFSKGIGRMRGCSSSRSIIEDEYNPKRSALPTATAITVDQLVVTALPQPREGFYSKLVDVDGIPVLGHASVSDKALLIAARKIWAMVGQQPSMRATLAHAGVQIHVIARHQSVTELPEFAAVKDRPLPASLVRYRRGTTGFTVSCGEENLLGDEADPFRDYDTLTQRFASMLFFVGLPYDHLVQVRKCRNAGVKDKRWPSMFSHLFFAATTHWYLGGPPPEMKRLAETLPPPHRLEDHDQDIFRLLDGIYAGTMTLERRPVAQVKLVPLAQPLPITTAAAASGSPTLFISNQSGITMHIRQADARDKVETVLDGHYDWMDAPGGQSFVITDDAGRVRCHFNHITQAEGSTGILLITPMALHAVDGCAPPVEAAAQEAKPTGTGDF